MPGSTLALDPAQTDVRLRTFAKGLLSALAHDLEIRATDVRGEADAEKSTATITVGVAGMKVVGSLKHGHVDTTVLSGSDVAEIERKIRSEVIPRSDVRVEASVDGRRATLRVQGPGGTASARCDVEVRENADGARVVSGKAKLSLKDLGVREVKGPLGAFKIDDTIEVIFSARFTA